jgi:endonuclease/exonuclease/phosphatase (EEP) superfamily protein YafD
MSKLLSAATILACIGTTAGFLGRDWWVFELASHFPVQYSAVLLTCALIYLIRAKYTTALVVAIFASVNLYLIIPSNVEVHAKASSSYRESRKFRVLLINVNHGNQNYNKVREFIRLTDADFIVLLEVNEEWLEELQPIEAAYPYRRGLPLKDYGIGLLSRIPFEDADIKIIGKVGNPSVIARFNIDGQRFTLIGTHPHPPLSQEEARYRNQQMAAIAKFISSQQDASIVLGDLNITPWSPLFRDFLVKTGLGDTRNGFGLQPSWPVKFPVLWIPLDHCLVSPKVVVHNREVGPNIGSDHYPIVVDFSLLAQERL